MGSNKKQEYSISTWVANVLTCPCGVIGFPEEILSLRVEGFHCVQCFFVFESRSPYSSHRFVLQPMEIVKNGLTEKVKSSDEKIKTIEVSFTTIRSISHQYRCYFTTLEKFNMLS